MRAPGCCTQTKAVAGKTEHGRGKARRTGHKCGGSPEIKRLTEETEEENRKNGEKKRDEQLRLREILRRIGIN